MNVETKDTLQEAKNHLRANFTKGTKCPCCGRLVKLYSYTINTSLAKALISLYTLSTKEPCVHVKDIVASLPHSCAKNFCILKHWSLIEEVINTDTKKRFSGFWKITPKGQDFVTGKLRVSKTIEVYNNTIYAASTNLISITDCLQNEFNYNDLLVS